MPRPLRTEIAALLAGLFASFAVLAQELPPVLAPEGAPLAQPDAVDRWLAEVRAQRQARDERRQAAKEAWDARRRWIDPWAAAQQEAREKQAQRRHDALIEHIERDREAFRNWIPWGFHGNPWQGSTADLPAQMPQSTGTDAAGVAENASPSPSTYPLPGWDNRWYFRGF
jgi:hypothetical protein